MAQQTINIGSSANDGTGDTLRTAGDKINDNFNELYTQTSAILDSADVVSIITDSDLNMHANDIRTTGRSLYRNEYDSAGLLPDNTVYGGMFAYTHNDQRALFSHDSAWAKLIDSDLLISGSYSANVNGTVFENLHLHKPVIPTGIYDSSGSVIVKFATTGTPTNYVNLKADATSSPTIGVEGGDSDIDLKIQAKGSGLIVVDGRFGFTSKTITNVSDTLDSDIPMYIFNMGTSQSFTQGNGTSAGEIRKIVNKSGTGIDVTLAFTNFGHPDAGVTNGVKMIDNAYFEIVWDGSQWQIDRDSDRNIQIV